MSTMSPEHQKLMNKYFRENPTSSTGRYLCKIEGDEIKYIVPTFKAPDSGEYVVYWYPHSSRVVFPEAQRRPTEKKSKKGKTNDNRGTNSKIPSSE